MCANGVDDHRGNFLRTAELQRIISFLDGLDHGAGKIIEVTGDPGMGKTRLLGGVMREAQRRGMTVQAARCTEQDPSAPLRTLSDVLGLRGLECQHPPGEATAAMPRGQTRPDADAMLLPGTARSILASRIQDPTIIILDDFHWADAASVMLVEYLIPWPADTPLLLIIAHRPRQASQHLLGTLAHAVELGAVQRFTLSPLTVEHCAELQDLDEDDDVLRDLHEHSGGTPMYLLALAETGTSAEAVPGERLPAWFSALIYSELSSLSQGEIDIATAAAVLGDDCDVEALAFVAEESLDETCEIVSRLVRRDLLRPLGNSLYFSFRHPLVRSVVYSTIYPSRHVQLQQRTLRILTDRDAPLSVVSRHIALPLTGSGQAEMELLVRAADRSIPSDSAARWLQEFLHTMPDRSDPQHNRLKFLLARALGVAGHLRESRNLLHEILAVETVEQGLRASTVAFCAILECLLGAYAEARALLDAELGNMSGIADPEKIALMIERGLIGTLDDDVPDKEYCEELLSAAQAQDDPVNAAASLALYGLSMALHGEPSGAASLLADSAFIIDALPDEDLGIHLEYCGLLGWAEALTGQFAESQRHFARATAIARRLGHHHLLPILLTGLSNAHRHAGHLEMARAEATEALSASRAVNTRHVEGLALVVQSLTLFLTDRTRHQEAIGLAEAAVGALRTGSFGWSFCGPVALATVRILGGQPEESSPLILDAGGGPGLPRIPVVLRPMCYGLLAAAVVKAEQPVDLWADLAKEAADACGTIPQRAHALVAQGNAMEAAGKHNVAMQLYSRASSAFRSSGMPVGQAHALLSEARAAIAAKAPEVALKRLVLAQELARQCGCHLISGFAQDRRREIQVTEQERDSDDGSISVLTKREAEIAAMAGAGKRTQEIARELSLSPRTVEVHLTRIYRKLKIPSRTALARLLAEQ